MSSVPGGARLAVDVGTVRIGVAVAAPGTSVAVPVETVAAGPGAVPRIHELIGQYAAEVVYVGDPIRLNGQVGPAAIAARDFARSIAGYSGYGGPSVTVSLKVQMVDERLTTAQSGRQLQAAGRKTRKSRSVIDQAAAVAILQAALERERVSGQLAGRDIAVEEQDGR